MIEDIDVKATANEVKAYLDDQKMNLVDYSLVEIECYPSPKDSKYPAIKKLSKAWETFFSASDKALHQAPNKLMGKPFDEILGMYNKDLQTEFKELEETTNKVAAAVNEDRTWWDKLRAEIVPLYDRSPHYEAWQKRWQKIRIIYDPVDMTVTTTRMQTNSKTGERIRGEVVRETDLPAGLVVKVD